MGKQTRIDSLFKRKRTASLEQNENNDSFGQRVEISPLESRPPKSPRIENENTEFDSIERDPGKRKQIWEYPIERRDEIRRAYLSLGPYQPKLSEYKKSGYSSHLRRFQCSWFQLYPSWLEYSPEVDAAFCLPCFPFNKPNGHSGQRAFTVDGFRNWKKVKNGKKCAFLNHVGRDPKSSHRLCEQACEDLKNQTQHMPQVLMRQTSRQIAENRLRLKASIDALLYLAFQGCSMRGRDESRNSNNRGNFVELVKILATYNEKVGKVVLENAPKNASYTSSDSQKEVLQVVAEKVKRAICEEMGDEKFCIIVDEASDKSRKEQMAIVLRYIDQEGFIRERFLNIVHVSDTTTLTLKKAILSVLSHYSLDIKNIRGQGYDGASNMRGEWNGLQTLISNECPYAYYIHCFAHRLQLALVAASKEVIPVYQFFSKLTSIVTFVLGSCKRSDELKAAYADEIASLIDNGELETGTGLNQIGNLQRPGDTRWSSHLKSISSLIKFFNATCVTLRRLVDDGNTPSQRGEAHSALQAMNSFDFIFVLYLMKHMMEITDSLCQALQRKSQDILNALHLVSSTKDLIQKLRDVGWEPLLAKVTSFCESHDIDVPDMTASYVERRGRARRQRDNVTIEHHYHVDIFNAVIDSQLQELNNRFNEKAVELLVLSCALNPREACKGFRVDHICKLAHKSYPQDFTEAEKEVLRVQLLHFETEIARNSDFTRLFGISELCRWLVETRKSNIYPLVYRLIKLVLTLPVSTATIERAFSAMNTIKTRIRNRMDDDFLESCMVIYIEREIAKGFSIDSIIDGFRDMKERRALL